MRRFVIGAVLVALFGAACIAFSMWHYATDNHSDAVQGAWRIYNRV